MKNIPIGILVVLIVLLIVAFIFFPEVETTENELLKFSSCEEMEDFVKTNMESYSYYGGFAAIGGTFGTLRTTTAQAAVTDGGFAPAAAEATGAGAAPAEKSEDYSTTNVQVTGVDEADIVKNDDKYIYVVSGKKVVIIDAYPAAQAEILSEIEINGTPQEIFINKDKLVVFGSKYEYGEYYGSSKTFIKVYDVSDRSNPVVKRDFSLDGSYYDSRMIGNYVYIIINEPLPYGIQEGIRIPEISSGGVTRAVCGCADVYYFDFPDYSYRFTTIAAINTQDDNEEVNSEVYLLGMTQNMYVSLNNIYITYMKRLSEKVLRDKMFDEVIIPSVPTDVANKINSIRNSDLGISEKWRQIGEILQNYTESLGPEEGAAFYKIIEEKMIDFYEKIYKEMEKTVIHKISVDKTKIEYKTNGEAPGNVLNQFSMDESNGYFRIATTTSQFSRLGGMAESKNHVYVLDSNLNIVGKVEDLAPGERIYSVRFIGDKAYMVTFRQVDPLFVIDLSNPNDPKVLGFLKVPGVSDYLHPYDETHIIGVGRDATEQGVMKGMKLSLFDVTDFSNPKEISKYIIGERGTDSEALSDHKAFLFSKSKNLLVIPVRLSEGGKWNAWQGAYVFNLDLVDGFTLKGKITHRNETENETDYYYYDYMATIRRSLYMDNTLYTVSSKMVKMNDLIDLDEINKVELPYEEDVYPYPRPILIE